ncbi:MAG: Do family serine endopeptidase [Verrucomicrobia bacterium]|nr:Do family serine endopeptidase [Verrucomicrobiota bacterium]
MKTNTIVKMTLLAIASGGVAFAAAHALEARANHAALAPNITLDSQPPDRDSRLPTSFADTLKRITPSVVKIDVTTKAMPAAAFGDTGQAVPFGGSDLWRFFEPRGRGAGRPPMPREHGAASGVIITSDGYVLTNRHVIDRADKVVVMLQDGRNLTAKVLGDDPKTDLALLKVDAGTLQAITFADSDQVRVGDIVLAVGNPFGIGQSVTMGMVSATGRATLGLDYEDFIQTDAAINPGNSGGALVDTQGRLVGINTAILSGSGGNNGVGFAIPSNLARNVMNDLITDGKVTRACLGVMVQDLTPALARQFGAAETTHGALVGEVPAKSPAAKAGVASGDVITGLAGQPVRDARSLKLAVGTHKPGERVDLKVLRDGAEKSFTATLEPLAGDNQATPAHLRSSGRSEEGDSLSGVGVADLDKATRREANIPADIKGALVTEVDEASAAWEAGLRSGDVIEQINRQPVASAEDAVKLTARPADRETLLRVWSHGGSHFLTVDEARDAR